MKYIYICLCVYCRTYGKSQIQHIFPLPNGGLLKLTVAEYLVIINNYFTLISYLTLSYIL